MIPGTPACTRPTFEDAPLRVLCGCGWNRPVPSRRRGHREHGRHVQYVKTHPRGPA